MVCAVKSFIQWIIRILIIDLSDDYYEGTNSYEDTSP